MSKIANEKALKEYPNPEFDGYYSKEYDDDLRRATWDRMAFVKGYDIANQDFLEKAVKWFHEHISEYFDVNEFNCDYLNEFINAMKDE